MHASIYCQIVPLALFLPLYKAQLGTRTVLLPRQVDRLRASEQSSSSAQQLRMSISSPRQGSHFRGSRTTLAPRGLLGAVGPMQSGAIPNPCATSLRADEVPLTCSPLQVDEEKHTPLCDFAPDGQSPFPLFPHSAWTRTRVPFVRLRLMQAKLPFA